MVTLLLLFSVFGLGFRSAWYRVSAEEESNADTLWTLAVFFLAAFILASITAVFYVSLTGKSAGFDLITWLDIAKIIIPTSIAWPAGFLTLLTCLQATRSSFLDWGSVPIFALFTTFFFSQADWMRITSGSLHIAGAVLCMVLTLLGIILLLNFKNGASCFEAGDWWPRGRSRKVSLIVGVTCALVSSCAGLLAVHFAGETVHKDIPPVTVLAVRLAALFPIVGLWAVCSGKRNFKVSRSQILRAIKFALLTTIPLFTLIYAKRVRPHDYTATVGFWLTTVPLWVLVSEAWIFRSQKAYQFTIRDYVGMSSILLSAILFEIFAILRQD